MNSFTYEYEVKQLNDAKWLKIFYHNSTDKEFFQNNGNEALFINTTNKFSILKYLPFINKYESEWYEFLLEYPEHPNATYHWRQSSSPLAVYQNPGSSSLPYEYKPIDIPLWDVIFQGLVRSDPNGYQRSYTFITGTPNKILWHYAIGAYNNWKYNNAFPGPAIIDEKKDIMSKYIIHEVILWVRIKQYYALFIPFCTCHRNYISYKSLMPLIMIYITLLK